MKALDQAKLMETEDQTQLATWICINRRKHVSMYVADIKTIVRVLGEKLNKSVLESVTQKGGKVVTGRYLFDWVKKGLAGIRKSRINRLKQASLDMQLRSLAI